MGLSCSGNFLKFLVFFFNGIVFLGGGMIAGCGIYVLVEAKQTGGTVSVVLPASITAFGLLLFLVGFLGCFGACCDNACMLITFAIVVGLLVVTEIVCGALILVYRNDFVRVLGDHLAKFIEDYENDVLPDTIQYNNASIVAIEKLQKDFKCCGGRGPKDWKTVPSSCLNASNDNPYTLGCAQAIYNEFKDSTLVVGIIILVVALIQIGAIICASCLAKKVNE